MIGRNNPFNIRNSKRNKWNGQFGSTKGFCNFVHMDLGIRAAIKIVMINYRRFGVKTIHDIITWFAPPFENDTDAYIKFVVRNTKIEPMRKLDSQDQYARVLVAMSQFEGNPVTFDQILHVMNMYDLKMNAFL